jgi:hypothetical protein
MSLLISAAARAVHTKLLANEIPTVEELKVLVCDPAISDKVKRKVIDVAFGLGHFTALTELAEEVPS